MAEYDDDEFFDHTDGAVFVAEDEEDEEDPESSAFMRGVTEAEQIVERDEEEDLY